MTNPEQQPMSDNPTPASETERLAEMLCRPCGATPSNQRVAAARLRALQAANERLREDAQLADKKAEQWANDSAEYKRERDKLKAENAVLKAELRTSNTGHCPHGYPQTVRCARCGE